MTQTVTPNVNRNLVLIGGKSSGGKSASLRTLKDPRGVIYLNCESGKELPFADNFRKETIVDPLQVHEIFKKAESSSKIHTIVVDTITFLMDMYESTRVLTVNDRRSAWGDYFQYWKELMQEHVAASTKNVLMLAHTSDVFNEKDGIMETRVKVKGSLMNIGIEAYFCNVIAAKKVPLTVLEGYKNDYLNITDEDKILGYKYVYQTRCTKDTVHETLRGPLDLWKIKESFIDNDAQLLLDHLHKYYST